MLVEMRADVSNDIFQVFYEIGNGYNENDSVTYNFSNLRDFSLIKLNIPQIKIKSFRIDPMRQASDIKIKNMKLVYIRENTNKSKNIFEWDLKKVEDDFKYNEHISHFAFNKENNSLEIKPIGNDPNFYSVNDLSKIYKDLPDIKLIRIIKLLLSFLMLLSILLIVLINIGIIICFLSNIKNFINKSNLFYKIIGCFKSIRSKRYFYFFIFLVLSFFSLFLIINKTSFQVILNPGRADAPVGPIDKNTILVQEIKGDFKEYDIYNIDILFATWNRVNTNNNEIYLLSENGNIIYKTEINSKEIQDNSYIRIPIKESLKNYKKIFILIQSKDGTEGNSVTIWKRDKKNINTNLYRLNHFNGDFNLTLAKLDNSNMIDGSLYIKIYGLSKETKIVKNVIIFILLLFIFLTAFFILFFDKIYYSKKIICLNEMLYKKMFPNFLIKIDLKFIIFVLVLIIYLFFSVFFKIHNNNIEMWNYTLPNYETYNETPLIFGSLKGLRGDEWLNSSPSNIHTLSVSKDSKNIFTHLNNLFSPWLWGGYFLDIERAFSFYNNLILVLTIFSFFLLLMILTKNDFFISLFGSLFLFFSSYNVWWGINSNIMSFSFIFVFLILFIRSQKIISVLFSFIFLLIFSKDFIMNLYPAWQVPISYLLLILIVGYIIENHKNIEFKKYMQLKIILFILTFIIGVIGVIYWYRSYGKEYLNVILNTVYPGRRFSTGGEMNILSFFSGFYGMFLTQSKYFFVNVCETSSFIFIFPLLIIFVKGLFNNKKINIILLCLLLYLLFFTYYIIFGIPKILAAITLISFVPSSRALIGIGFANAIFLVLFISNLKRNYGAKTFVAAIISIIVFVLLYIFGTYFLEKIGVINYFEMLFTAVIISVIVYLLLRKKIILACILLFLMVFIPSIGTNPITIGFSYINNNPIIKFTGDIIKKDNHSKWLVYQGIEMPQFIKFVGANVFNGTKFPPDLKSMYLIDPEQKNKNVYNRYAKIEVHYNEIVDDVKFDLLYADHYVIKINPCSKIVKDLGIKYIMIPNNYSEKILDDLRKFGYKQLNILPLTDYYIFEVM